MATCTKNNAFSPFTMLSADIQRLKFQFVTEVVFLHSQRCESMENNKNHKII